MVAILDKLLFSHWRILNEEARAEREADGHQWDWRPLIAMVICAVDLTLHEYYGHRDFFAARFHQPDDGLAAFGWWSGIRAGGYFLVPFLSLLALRQNPMDYGLSLRGFFKHAWIYGVLFGAIFPVIIGASFTRPFQEHYPFYKAAGRSWADFWEWEAIYGAQFLTLEFFFRGYLLFMLRKAMGAYAIFAMIVPYCMIHYHKPIAEVLGAIFAGMILGTLALRTRSIWFGIAIHLSVALTMDIASLLHAGQFPPGR